MSGEREAAPSQGLLLAGVLLVAASLRPAVSSVGPLLAEIRTDLGLAGPAAALLTSLPVLCFGLVAPFGPRLARRFGIEGTLALVVTTIALGLLGRVVPLPHGPLAPAALFAGTIVVGAAIAVGNVLVVPLIRRDFHGHLGLYTGLYTGAMTVASTVAAGASVPLALASGLGWRGGLGFWALPAAIALVAWLPQLRHGAARHAAATAAAAGQGDGLPLARLLRDRVAWAVTLFMGLQSLVFYSTLAWLPSVYRAEGMSPTDAGLLLSLTTLVAIPAGLVTTARAGRARHQSAAAAGATLVGVAGLLGIALAPTAAPLAWAVLLGIGQGSTFPLALTMVALRAGSVATTGRLSAMAQSIGYAMAALGPLVVGLIHDLTAPGGAETAGAWTPAIGTLVALSAVQLWAAIAAGRSRTVGGG